MKKDKQKKRQGYYYQICGKIDNKVYHEGKIFGYGDNKTDYNAAIEQIWLLVRHDIDISRKIPGILNVYIDMCPID